MARVPVFLLALALTLTACDTVAVIDPTPETAGIIVASQGQFGADDGGVALFRLDGTVARRYEGLYVQSATLYQDHLYVTSTDRIDVLHPFELVRTGQFRNILNPRYLAFDGNVGFVTSLYTRWDRADGFVTRLDLAAGTTGPVAEIGGSPDGIARVGYRLYVANYDFGSGRTVTVLHTATLAEIERIDVGCDGPRFLFADEQQEVLVFCTGNAWATPASNGAFVVLDGRTGAVLTRLQLDSRLRTASLGQMATYVPELQEAYAIDDEGRRVLRFDTRTNTLGAILNVGGAPINAVAYDPRRGYLYLGRLNETAPFTAQGTLTVHTRQGALVETFHDAGVVPTHLTILVGEAE